jgi:uncharacterized protein (DUF433 family)
VELPLEPVWADRIRVAMHRSRHQLRLVDASADTATTRAPMNLQDEITRDPAICGGQAVLKGTRIPVRIVLGHLARGASTAALLAEFPSLTENHVRAVVAFAAASASEDLPAPTLPPREATTA